MKRRTGSEAETKMFGAEFSARLAAGEVVLFEGQLGAGKTTMIRGLVEALGHEGPVRSPTFNLIQTFETKPPVMHADLYRLRRAEGIGLEDYLDTHLCLIEWPDRLHGFIEPDGCWRVSIAIDREGRSIEVREPERA
jgi:tRNA threonylcarbamoyladenosine biosynthesis protein TsaE